MGHSASSLDVAPELTFEDLQHIKVPVDLLEVLGVDFCQKLKILPLRLDTTSKVFSFIFVDPTLNQDIDHLKTSHGWHHLSAYRVSEHTFMALLSECKRLLKPDALRLKKLVLVEEDQKLFEAMNTLLTSQAVQCLTWSEFQKFPKEPVDAFIFRAPISPDFEATLKLQQPSAQIIILNEHWLESLLLSETSSKELDFHIRHENFFQAALSSMKQGDLFKAIELLEQVQTDDPDYEKACLYLGKAFIKKRNYTKASFHLQRAYDHWCEDPDAIVDDWVLNILYYLAISFEKLNRLDDALKLFERVAGENPLFKQVNLQLARIKDRQRKANQTREKKEGLPAFSRNDRQTNRYDKIEEIGRGGMGIVYRARDRVLGREVALKVLNSHFKHDEKIVETFLREAKSLAALNHLHIVTVFDAGVEDGNYYIAMEFIEGRTVRELLKKKGHFKLGTTIALSRQVLKALAYAHSKRVIHRDITTNNMMLTESKVIKLMDFGLARVVNQLHSEQSIIGGTPYFMSPEQVEGAPIDHRTDLYSFGVCLFEMLTGQVPFPMENPGYHHLHTPPPNPQMIKPDLPLEVCHIILKCLEKAPDNRFSKAEEIIDLMKKISSSDFDNSTASRSKS